MKAIQLHAGQRFGLYTVIGLGEPYTPARGGTQARWLCRCDCGTERNVWASALVRGKSTSCGCTRNAGLKAAGVHRRLGVISYFGMHRRLARDRGKAREQSCADCGRRAEHWSYDGTDPAELHYDPPGKRRLAYSLDQSRYLPRCRSCHNLHDGIEPPAETRIRRRAAS